MANDNAQPTDDTGFEKLPEPGDDIRLSAPETRGNRRIGPGLDRQSMLDFGDKPALQIARTRRQIHRPQQA